MYMYLLLNDDRLNDDFQKHSNIFLSSVVCCHHMLHYTINILYPFTGQLGKPLVNGGLPGLI